MLCSQEMLFVLCKVTKVFLSMIETIGAIRSNLHNSSWLVDYSSSNEKNSFIYIYIYYNRSYDLTTECKIFDVTLGLQFS